MRSAVLATRLYNVNVEKGMSSDTRSLKNFEDKRHRLSGVQFLGG